MIFLLELRETKFPYLFTAPINFIIDTPNIPKTIIFY